MARSKSNRAEVGTRLIRWRGFISSGAGRPPADVDGAALSYSLVAKGDQGSATVTNPETGAYTYSATAGASGTDRFTFQASDAAAGSNVATVTVTIQAPGAHDETALVSVTLGSLRLDRRSGHYLQRVGPARSRHRAFRNARRSTAMMGGRSARWRSRRRSSEQSGKAGRGRQGAVLSVVVGNDNNGGFPGEDRRADDASAAGLNVLEVIVNRPGLLRK